MIKLLPGKGLGMNQKKFIDSKNLYLDLLKACLTNIIYGESEMGDALASDRFLQNLVENTLSNVGLRLVRIKKYQQSLRLVGRDWPITAHTMIGVKRLDNIQLCIEDVLAKNVEGDLIETGIWRGGATIFMRAILKVHQIKNRVVWVADSFKGLPKPNPKKYPQDSFGHLHTVKYISVSLSQVKKNFKTYGLLDNQVKFLSGYFKDTLAKAPIKKLSVIRFDGDTYEATIDVLNYLYPKLSQGGYMIIDDYRNIPAVQQAVDDYRKTHNITDKIQIIDWSSVFWQCS